MCIVTCIAVVESCMYLHALDNIVRGCISRGYMCKHINNTGCKFRSILLGSIQNEISKNNESIY